MKQRSRYKAGEPDKEDYANLNVDETSYEVPCPICGHKKSFSITRIREGILYNCFRATCSNRGFISALDYGSSPKTHTPKKQLKPPNYEDCVGDYAAYIQNKFEIHPSDFGIKWCPDWDCYYFPFTINGVESGYGLRKYADICVSSRFRDGQKFMCFSTSTLPVCHIYDKDINGPIVVVEDFISACKISKFRSVLALNGTNFHNSIIPYIHNRDLIIWLDYDARLKALNIRKENRIYFNSIRVLLYIEEDPKDLPFSEIEKILDK